MKLILKDNKTEICGIISFSQKFKLGKNNTLSPVFDFTFKSNEPISGDTFIKYNESIGLNIFTIVNDDNNIVFEFSQDLVCESIMLECSETTKKIILHFKNRIV